MRGRRDAVSALCGTLWGLIGWMFARDLYSGPAVATGALLLSPSIGILVGRIAAGAPARASLWERWMRALLGLYGAMVLFMVALLLMHVSLGWWSTGAVPRLGGNVLHSVFVPPLFVLFGGWFVVFWPAAFLTHQLFWPRRSDDTPAGTPTRVEG